jgi:hypothetical protein
MNASKPLPDATESLQSRQATTVRYYVCKRCGIRYLQADFLPYRVAGFCTEECERKKPRGVPTAECIGWKNGIPASTQRKQILPLPLTTEAPRKWLFDMVHSSAGWQLENWRLADE